MLTESYLLFIAGFESLINRTLALDPHVKNQLSPLAGQRLYIELTGLPISLTLLASPQGIELLDGNAEAADSCIKAPPFSLLRLVLTPNALLTDFPDIQLSGSTHTAQQFSNLFKQLDIDWEEQLSHLIGDIPARAIMYRLQSEHSKRQRHYDEAYQNLGEFLQEELRTTLTQAELDIFLDDVDNLRDDVARLAQRIQRLTHTH